MHARRLPLALALAALTAAALPGVASAQARRGGGGVASGNMQLGAFIGIEDGPGDTGLALRLDGEVPIQHLSPQIRMSFVGSFGYTRWTYHYAFFSDLSSTLNIFKLTPALRFTFGNHPTIRPYADGGIGLHYARFSVRQRDAFGNVYTASDSDVSLHLRFAGGIQFQLSPAFSIGAEADLIPYFGNLNDNTFALLFGATFRT